MRQAFSSVHDKDIEVLQAPNIPAGAIVHGFSTAPGGASSGGWLDFNRKGPAAEYAENIARLAAVVGFSPARLFVLRQVHSARVVEVVADSDPQHIGEQQADGLMTDQPGVALGVFTADCVPVLLADPDVGAVAAVHAGWRGVAAEIVPQTVDAMVQAYGATPTRMAAAIGPHIGASAFEVGPEVAEQLDQYPGAVDRSRAKPHIDLAAVVRQQLAQRGVSNTSHAGLCTKLGEGRLFSYRRQGDQAGRQLNVIGLEA